MAGGPGLTIRTTGDPQADRTQAATKAAVDSLVARVTALESQIAALKGLSPSGVQPGTVVIASTTSFDVNTFGQVTKVTP